MAKVRQRLFTAKDVVFWEEEIKTRYSHEEGRKGTCTVTVTRAAENVSIYTDLLFLVPLE